MKNSEKIWIDKQDDLELLVLEISELKHILREVSQQMLRIERRIKATLPSSNGSGKSTRRQRLDHKTAHATINRLTECAGKGRQIENELRRMTVKDELSVLASELGMTNTKLPPKDDLIRRLSTRLRQRASVTAGIRETSPAQKERAD